MNKEYIFFDLDGTITNSQEGIINSFKYALNYYGIEIKDDSEMKKVLGPPLHYSFENFFNIKKENIEEVVKKYREYYNSKGLYENSVYEGMEEVIKTLKGNNKKLVIATSKPTYFTKKILEHFDLLKYFDYVSGAELDGSICKKSDIIAIAISKMNIKDLDKVVMIGDREYDIIGANENNIDSIGVLYGYGSKKEFIDNGANLIVSTPKEILENIY